MKIEEKREKKEIRDGVGSFHSSKHFQRKFCFLKQKQFWNENVNKQTKCVFVMLWMHCCEGTFWYLRNGKSPVTIPTTQHTHRLQMGRYVSPIQYRIAMASKGSMGLMTHGQIEKIEHEHAYTSTSSDDNTDGNRQIVCNPKFSRRFFLSIKTTNPKL